MRQKVAVAIVEIAIIDAHGAYAEVWIFVAAVRCAAATKKLYCPFYGTWLMRR
ncbi:MAG: hypothetical protein AAF289_05735 [Cyanobacteria bacterium P01_A01_bin.135]